jgi:hypothetical protein
MRTLTLLCGFCLAALAAPVAAQTPLPATDVTAAQMKAFIDGMPKDAITDSAIRAVDVGGSRVGIYGVFRPKSLPGDAIAHETKTTEVYVILQGAGTLVTGGQIVGTVKQPTGRSSGPRGEKIEGGVSRRVTVGDVIVIPGRTPHWWSSLEGDIRYMIVRADPVGTMTLK